jgi:hypothetical protein
LKIRFREQTEEEADGEMGRWFVEYCYNVNRPFESLPYSSFT